MKRITDDIKSGNFKNLYFLYGEEDYLRKQYRDMLKKAIVGDDDMNYSYYEGKDINVNALIDQAETLPFFAERRLIVIDNSGFFKAGGEELADYLKEAPATTYFVICDSEVDKRSKLFKTCTSVGVAVEMKSPDEMTLTRWVNKMLSESGKKMTERDIEYFLELTGEDMTNIRNEVEKLICYVGDKDIITAADADEIVTKQINNHIFEMVEAIGNRNQKKAMDLYYELLTLREPPFRILSLVARQFNLLLQTKELLLNNVGNSQIAEKIKVPPFAVKKYVYEARQFDMASLKKALEACVKADEDIKSGRMTDKMSVELLIVEFSK